MDGSTSSAIGYLWMKSYQAGIDYVNKKANLIENYNLQMNKIYYGSVFMDTNFTAKQVAENLDMFGLLHFGHIWEWF